MTTITEALRAARACIQQDRTILADTGMRHDNTMDPDAAAGVAEYDAVLAQIDTALASMTHNITDEQIEKAYEAEMRQSLHPQSRATLVRVCRAVLALAAPQGEPFGYFRALPFGWEQCAEGDEGAVALYTAPAPAVPSVFAKWWTTQGESMVQHHSETTQEFARRLASWAWTEATRAMLTAAPTPPAQPSREPMTEDDMDVIMINLGAEMKGLRCWGWMDLVRAVEAHHGITARPKAARAAEKGGA